MEKSDDRIAQTVIENTKAKDQKILQLNSMQSIPSEEIADGATSLSVMEDNLRVLKEARNEEDDRTEAQICLFEITNCP